MIAGIPKRELSAVALIAILQFALLVALAARVGITVDEPAHLLSAHLYWAGEDKLAPRDMPPLLKILSGSVASQFNLPIPRDHESWKKQHEWDIAIEMMNRMDRTLIERVFFWSRLPMTIFPVACGLLLWWWARQLFSWPAALAAQAIIAFSPTALGHGALVKNDMAATFGYLLFWYTAWRWWRTPNLFWAASMGVAITAAMLAKMSMLILPPLGLLIVLLKLRCLRAKPLAAAFALVLLIPYAASLTAWQFDTRRLQLGDIAACQADPQIPSWVCLTGRVFHVLPLPKPLWEGVEGLLRSNDTAPAVYFLGKTHEEGLPQYFLVALALKMTEPAIALFLAGLAVTLWRLFRRQLTPADLFWTLPGFLYVGLASNANLQLGVRLVLPALPFLALIAAQFVHILPRRGANILCTLTILLTAGVSLRAFPNEISYFNAFAGGPSKGIEWLSDSNLDWGQSLRELRREVTARRIPFLKFSYFGTDNVWAYFNDKEIAPLYPPWSPAMAEGHLYHPAPGWYAISATLLTGQLFSAEYRGYFADFRRRPPVARIGNSIFLYQIPPPPPAPAAHAN